MRRHYTEQQKKNAEKAKVNQVVVIFAYLSSHENKSENAVEHEVLKEIWKKSENHLKDIETASLPLFSLLCVL